MTSVSGNLSAKSLSRIIRKEKTTHLAILRSPNTIATADIKCSSRLVQRCQEKLVVECEKEHVVSTESRKY